MLSMKLLYDHNLIDNTNVFGFSNYICILYLYYCLYYNYFTVRKYYYVNFK